MVRASDSDSEALLRRGQGVMANEISTNAAAREVLGARRVGLMAAVALLAGLAIGYVLPGSSPAVPSANASTSSIAHPAMGNAHMPSMDEMKTMADKQAEPLLAKLQSDPNNAATLAQLGAIYHITHQFRDAAVWYGKAVEADPKNVALRTKLATSLYRAGDVDGALSQVQAGLALDPKDANSLFNLGMIRLQGKGDGPGAVAAWQKLLKTNPQLNPEQKATVLKLIADVLTTTNAQSGGAHGAHAIN